MIVCGDSHTATHGAFGALAFGIGTSEVEHVLATQTLPQAPPKTLAVEIEGTRPVGTTAKDLILYVLNRLGTAGGTGYVIEYRGEAIRDLSMEERMTVCNMSIEGGARAGLIAPDETTFAYLKDRPYAPKGADWDAAVQAWRELPPTRAPASTRSCGSTPPTSSPTSPGAPRRPSPSRSARPSRASRTPRTTRPASSTSGRWTTWAWSAATPITDIGDRHGVHRLVHQRPAVGPAPGRRGREGQARSPTASARWSCRAPAW